MKQFIYGFLILLLLVYYYYYLPFSCDVSVCHFHDDLQNLPKGWVFKTFNAEDVVFFQNNDVMM